MALTFPRAPRAARGEDLTSTQLAGLAGALNARLRSGLADPTFRIFQSLLGCVRQIRNGDAESLLLPSQTEFFDRYQALHPDAGTWPIADAGDPYGANIASAINAYQFGAASFNLYNEASRLSDPLYGGIPLEVPSGTLPESTRIWNLRKLQVGAWDPITGAVSVSAFSAARAFAAIYYSPSGPHGTTYGGWHPTPNILSSEDCLPLSSDGSKGAPINYQIQFQATDAGLAAGHTDKTYPGTCIPVEWTDPPTPYEGHVAGIIYTPWSYYILINPATLGDPYTVEELPRSYYTEGPYDGHPRLHRSPGNQIDRALDALTREFRGAHGTQIPSPPPGGCPAGAPPTFWLSCAFDIDQFCRRQYLLAPQRGIEGPADVVPVYPTFTAGHAPAGTAIPAKGAKVYLIHPGCVAAGYHAAATSLMLPVTVDAIAAAGVVGSVTLTPDSPAGTRFLATPVPSGKTIEFRLRNELCVKSGGALTIELAECMDYKPQRWDLFLVLRLAGARMTPE